MIHALRKERGLTLEAVALEADTNTGNLSRIEKGTRRASIGLLERIAAALNTTVAELYTAVEGKKYPLQPPPELQDAEDIDFASDAIQLRRYFRVLTPENKRLAVELLKLLNRLQLGK